MPSARANASVSVASLSLAERVCLALVATAPEPVHGWALVRELSSDGPIGRIWSLSRPLTYRAIDQLVAARLIRTKGQTRGQGAERRLLVPTAAGARLANAWLNTPVAHLRDVRTELLAKLAIAERAGRDLTILLDAQRTTFDPLFAALAARPPVDVVDRWRQSSALATRAFLDQLAPRNQRPRRQVGGGRRASQPLP